VSCFRSRFCRLCAIFDQLPFHEARLSDKVRDIRSPQGEIVIEIGSQTRFLPDHFNPWAIISQKVIENRAVEKDP